MKLETLRCNHCGGPLSVPESANFVTCNHCGTQLAIRRTESTTFTEQLGKIQSNQQQMLQKLAQLERQNQLEEIDREWERERKKYMTTLKNGQRVEPTELGSLAFGIVAGIFGIIWTISTFSMTAAMPAGMGFRWFSLFGLLFVVFGIGSAFYGYSRAKDYRTAYRRYLQRRSEAESETTSDRERTEIGQRVPKPEL